MKDGQPTARQAQVRRLRALFRKEFRQVVRDPSSILIAFVLPAILLFLFGYGVSLDLTHVKVGLVIEDSTPEVQSFVKSFANSRYFDVLIARDRRVFERDLALGNIRAIIDIPSDFSRLTNRVEGFAPIQVITDGSEPNTANLVGGYVQGAFQAWLNQQALDQGASFKPLVDIQPRVWFNEELESRNFLVPGSMATIMAVIGTLLTALVIAREWERGTMEALMATPVTISELLIGKFVPYFVLGMGSMAVCVFIAVVAFAVPFRGSYFVLALVTAAFLWAALGMGLLISTVGKTQFVASQAALIASFLPAFILSGFVFDIASMPWPIRMLTYALPARYFVSCLQTLFLAGNIWALIWPNVLAMLCFGLAYFAFTWLKSVKRLD
ncbi:MAG: ABC transporter permease [Desulfomonilaceae bacterium]